MSRSPVVCRLCQGNSSSKNSISLAGKRREHQQWNTRLSQLLLVSVALDDGLPQHVCMKCIRRVETLEKALKDLDEFRILAGRSYDELSPLGSRKRSKECSGVSATPETIRSRPPAKKSTSVSSRRLDFGQELRDVTNFQEPSCVQDHENDATCNAVHVNLDVVFDSPLRQSGATNSADNSFVSPNAPTVSGTAAARKHVKISVDTPSRTVPWSRELADEQEAKLGRAIAGGHIPTVAKAVLAYSDLREAVLRLLVGEIDTECAVLCQKKEPSLFRKLKPSNLLDFHWKMLMSELEEKAPLLLQVLQVIVSRNDRRNQHKEGVQHYPGICMAVAVLLKERNREICGVQSVLSLLLFFSHAEKKVYTRLNHVNVCTSYTAVLHLVQDISKFHKDPIQQWIKDGAVFKFVGDNIDKKRRVRDMRSDHQAEMLHMYSVLVSKSRLPSSSLSQTGQVANLTSIPWKAFLPSKDDIQQVESNLVILVARLLTTYIKDLSFLSKVVPNHIKHKYSSVMSTKSEVAVVDVLLKNEAYGPDMIDIMQTLHQYLGSDYQPERRVASGGDQLTCERQAASQRHMMHEDTSLERMDILEPVAEDWHCLVCVLTTIWKRLYHKSALNHGTLGFFKSKLNRSNVKSCPKDDVNASLDFITTVVNGHLVACACNVLGISSPDSHIEVPGSIKSNASRDVKLEYVSSIAREVVKKCTLVKGAYFDNVEESNDGVYNYARVLCHYGALIMEFQDAWAEGDGNRAVRCWRLFLPHFVANHHTKYALQALRLQFQVSSYPSPQLSHHIVWDRFINTKGGQGRNIPCDLYNEHVNKNIKQIIANMGSNLTESALQRAARASTALSEVCKHFDLITDVPVGTSAHSTRADAHDVSKVVSTVLSKKLLSIIPKRKHTQFKQIKLNPLYCWKVKETEQWIEKKKLSFAARGGAARGEGNESDAEATDDECTETENTDED